MVEIRRREGEVAVTGHADYAGKDEKDIVCAGVSALTITLASGLEQLTEDSVVHTCKEGDVRISYGSLSKPGEVLMGSFFIGVGMIAEKYPDHVKLIDQA
ncbi:MAG: ribosomal-processing cysteine protease Prp [Eubacterium sp.]|nr:ribosomal-processing cysteine protease Prp [Eubacterium sp.]